MIASIENMRAHYAPGVFAASVTGEEYSANPGDYWSAAPDLVLKDSEGEPMRLVTSATTLIEVTA